jgi:Skp family chaperone for outer membrane proteins
MRFPITLAALLLATPAIAQPQQEPPPDIAALGGMIQQCASREANAKIEAETLGRQVAKLRQVNEALVKERDALQKQVDETKAAETRKTPDDAPTKNPLTNTSQGKTPDAAKP